MSDISWTNTRVKLGDLKPWSDNPRMSTKAQAKRLLASFDKFGQVQTVAIDPDCNVLDGHQRLSALLTIHGAGYEVDARQSNRPLTDAERRELVVSLHAGAVGSWDWDKVSGWNAAELQGWGMDKDLLKSWNNDANNLKELLKSEQPGVDAEPQVDRAAELLEKWQVQPGDLWQIGEHRLICGDCTDAATVARVMGGEKARLVITSPPYAEQRKETYGGIPMDKYVTWWDGIQRAASDTLSDDGSFFVNIKPHCEDGQRVLYVLDLVLSMVREWGWKLIDELCWVRQSMPNGTKYRFRNGFEPVYHFAKNTPFGNFSEMRQIASEMTKPKRYRKSGSGSGLHNFDYDPEEGALPDNVIMINTGEVNIGTRNHPATFPVRLPEFFITGFSAASDSVFEPFSGSGTTLVACENLRRRCRAIEISPAYVAVALERMSLAFPHLDIRRVDA